MLTEYAVAAMDRDAPVIRVRERAPQRVKGMPDTLTLRLEALVPPGCGGRRVVAEQRLTRRGCLRRSRREGEAVRDRGGPLRAGEGSPAFDSMAVVLPGIGRRSC